MFSRLIAGHLDRHNLNCYLMLNSFASHIAYVSPTGKIKLQRHRWTYFTADSHTVSSLGGDSSVVDQFIPGSSAKWSTATSVPIPYTQTIDERSS